MKPSAGLLATFQDRLARRQRQSVRRRLTIAPQDFVDFSSNDFLSLSTSSELRATYVQEFAEAEGIPLGSGGSRLLDGNSEYAENLEQRIAAFHRAPSGLLFNSGFDANAGMFACLPQPGDAVIYDEFIHASVHEGMRLSQAQSCKPFAHNCTASLRRELMSVLKTDPAFRRGDRNVFVAVETVYSMDGDVAPVKAILDVIDELLPQRNGHLIVDEAHSTGVYGQYGRGVICDLGVEHRVLARLHTFGKALSSGGAILLCPPIMRDYLINYARSLIYTTALGLPTLAMINSVYKLMIKGATDAAQRRLWKLIAHLHASLQDIPSSDEIQIPREEPKSPIFSICTPDPRSLAKQFQDSGFMVRPIVPPTVPEGGERVRVCLHAGNTFEEIDRLVVVLRRWLSDKPSRPTMDQPAQRARL